MLHLLWNYEPLARLQFNRAPFEIDQQRAVQYEEKLVDVAVFVPMVFALDHGHPHDRIVNFAKCLVVPFVGAGISQLLHVDHLQRFVQNV